MVRPGVEMGLPDSIEGGRLGGGGGVCIFPVIKYMYTVHPLIFSKSHPCFRDIHDQSESIQEGRGSSQKGVCDTSENHCLRICQFYGYSSEGQE